MFEKILHRPIQILNSFRDTTDEMLHLRLRFVDPKLSHVRPLWQNCVGSAHFEMILRSNWLKIETFYHESHLRHFFVLRLRDQFFVIRKVLHKSGKPSKSFKHAWKNLRENLTRISNPISEY